MLLSLFCSPGNGRPGPALHQPVGHPVSSGQAQHFNSHHRKPANHAPATTTAPQSAAAGSSPSSARPHSAAAAAAASAAARAHSAPRSPCTAQHGELNRSTGFSWRKSNQSKKKNPPAVSFCRCSSSADASMSHSSSHINVSSLLIFSCLWLQRT